MSSEQLMHIFDNSSCLTKRQLQTYAANEMIPEEAHAVEVHLNACPFCRMSVEGLQIGGEYAIEAVGELNPKFLKDHFSINNPQIHLNSITATVSHQPVTHHHSRRIRHKKNTLFTPWTISVAFLLLIGAWYMEFGRAKTQPMTNASTHQSVVPFTSNNEPKPAEIAQPKTEKDYTEPVASKLKTAKVVKRTGQPIVTNAAYIQEQPLPAANNSADADNQSSAINSSADKSSIEEKPKVFKAMTPITKKSPDETSEKQNVNRLGNPKQTMKSDDKVARHDAALMTAESYVNTGKNEKAIPLLQQIIDEGGPRKHAAKRLMRQIKRDEPVNID